MDETNNLDWVTARANCSLTKVFKELEIGVRGDIDIRNHLNDGAQFEVVNVPPHEFTIIRKTEGRLPRSVVTFSIAGDGINFTGEGCSAFRATLILNSRGQCRLNVEDQELTQWQVRMRALETLFF